MRLSTQLRWIGSGICTGLVLCLTLTTGMCREAKQERAIAPAMHGPSQQRMLPDHNTGECGGVFFDRATGGTRKIPNVDLVVTRMEITRNNRGTWVRPWIKNRCSGPVTKPVHVSIGDIVVTITGVGGNIEKTTSAVGVPSARSYTAMVDYDHQIAEANEANNRCTRSTSGRCR